MLTWHYVLPHNSQILFTVSSDMQGTIGNVMLTWHYVLPHNCQVLVTVSSDMQGTTGECYADLALCSAT